MAPTLTAKQAATLERIKAKAVLWDGRGVRIQLSTMAKWVNETMGDRYEARMERGFNSGDRPVGGGSRLRNPGKGQEGTRIKILDKTQQESFWRGGTQYFMNGRKVVLDHDATEAYRHNGEVARKVVDLWRDYCEGKEASA